MLVVQHTEIKEDQESLLRDSIFMNQKLARREAAKHGMKWQDFLLANSTVPAFSGFFFCCVVASLSINDLQGI